jgi:hypothetical protein
MQSPQVRPTPHLDQLAIGADQRAVLKALVRTLRDDPAASTNANADANRASAAAELMSDNTPIGEDTRRTPASLGASATTPAQATQSRARAMVLVVAGDLSAPERVAEAVAQDLGRELLPVDLTRVVSKFIAETEKHLEEVFDAAGDTGAVLFFNEADALFGQGGAAAAIHFADQEVGYLLHHIEGYNGVSILGIHAGTPLDRDILQRFACVVHLV